MFFFSFGFSKGNPHPRIDSLVYHRGPTYVNPCLARVVLMQQPMINNGLRLVVHFTTKVFPCARGAIRQQYVHCIHTPNHGLTYVHQCRVQCLTQCHTTEKHMPPHSPYKRHTRACKFQAMSPSASLESAL